LLDRHPVHAGVGEACGHVAAGGHDMVEALVGLGPEVEGRRLGPFAEVQGGQGGGVGVAEAHYRHAQLVADVERRMAGHEHVAGLDHVGAQAGEHRLPLRQAGRHAVAVAERQPRRRDRDQAVGLPVQARAGHDHGVAQVRPPPRQPRALGRQVALHPARLGRPHHRGVDQVEALGGGREGARGRRVEADGVVELGGVDVEHFGPGLRSLKAVRGLKSWSVAVGWPTADFGSHGGAFKAAASRPCNLADSHDALRTADLDR
jgi:hypothetical protein